MNWYNLVKGQKSWRDVLPGKKAKKPRQKERPPLPKLDARTRKELSIADRQAAHRPLKHIMDDEVAPLQKKSREQRPVIPNIQRRMFIEGFVRICALTPSPHPWRHEMSFSDWKLLYRQHALTPIAAAIVLHDVSCLLIEKPAGRRVWWGSPNLLDIAAEQYKDP